MAFGLLIILFLIGITFRNHSEYTNNPKLKSWTRNQRLIVAFFIAVLPFILVNLFIPTYRQHTAEEIVKDRKNFDKDAYKWAVEHMQMLYPDSLDIHIKVIDHKMRDYENDCFKLINSNYSDQAEINKIVQEYAMIRCGEQLSYSYDKYIGLDTIKGSYRGLDFVKAQGNLSLGNDKRAIEYFEQEIKKNPDFEEAYYPLGELLIRYDAQKYYTYLKKPEFVNHLPASQWLDFYFDQGKYLDYLWGTIYYRVTSITPFAFLASLLISFVWLFFIRSMDIFRKESWTDLLLVFSLGSIFSFLCLLFYAFAERVLHFYINGDAVNDFFYSVFVIGFSEELVKFLPWIIFGMLFKKFKEPYDYILFASVSALGFAFAENWMYLESSGNIVLRSVMAVVSHMFDASVVAYGFILARFRFKKLGWKIVSIVGGFALSAFGHGFYDFWLISPSTQNMYGITMVFFILTLHLWFYFKNNAINQSIFFTQGIILNREKLQDQITYSIIGILMLEFVFISYEYGTEIGNEVFGYKTVIIAAFIFYITFMLYKMDIRKGVWIPYSIKIPYVSNLFADLSKSSSLHEDHTGLLLRLWTPTKKTFVSRQLPVTGRCVKKLSIDSNPNWYLFELDKPVYLSGYLTNKVILKNRFGGQSLGDENVEVVCLFIPSEKILEKQNIEMAELHYEERLFTDVFI